MNLPPHVAAHAVKWMVGWADAPTVRSCSHACNHDAVSVIARAMATGSATNLVECYACGCRAWVDAETGAVIVPWTAVAKP